MNIRTFRLDDTQQVVELWTECGLVKDWNDPVRDIHRKMAVNPELFLVGEIDGKIIATIMGGYEGHRGWINYLAVAKECRSQRYARQLLTVIEDKLLALECPKINLQIRSTNLEVLEFYKHLGYVVDEAVSMGKRLIPDN